MVEMDKSTAFSLTSADMPVRFGRYLLIKRLGSDPVGEEFLALWGVDEGIDQLRVLRCIYPHVARESQFVGLFIEEARALSRLASANVTRVMEVATEGEIPFVAREHVEGLTLERMLKLADARKVPCRWDLATHLTAELLRGLDYVHRRENLHGVPMGMRHGDVRPRNVHVSFGGEVKLTNFGSSLYFIVDEGTNARLQDVRGIYSPPEGSGQNEEATIAGDLWGAAAILLTLLAGHGVLASISRTKESWKLPTLTERVEAMPPVLDTLLARALNPDPAYRFGSAAEMRDELLAIMSEHVQGHPPDELAVWVRDLGDEEREQETGLVRGMLGQEPAISLGDAAESGRLGPGTVLDGRYHLLRLLGEGGMGQVYEAQHLGLERRVAIKVLHERVLDDEVAVERFRREAQITGGLGHPGIVGVLDFGVTEEGHHYLAMELLEGESLASRIARNKSIPAREVVSIMAKVMDALEAAHRAGVVHRDLKPENIFLTSEGPRIVDFGIAKRTGLEETEQALTKTGHICGTVEYVSPELVRGMTPDHRCDIYSAGIIIYEALCGQTPFRGRNIGETLHKIMNDKLVPPRLRTGDMTIPKELERVCMRALSRGAARRYASAAEMGEALTGLLPIMRRRAEDRGGGEFPRGTSVRWWFVAVGAVALGGVAAWLLIGGEGAPDSTGSGLKEAPALAEQSHIDPGGRGVDADRPVASEGGDSLEALPVRVLGANAGDGGVTPKTATPPVGGASAGVDESRAADARGSSRASGPDDRTEELLSRGSRALRQMRLGEARGAFEAVVEKDPRISRGWFALGKVAFEEGRPAEAAGHIRHALKLSPGRYRWRVYLGKVLMTSGKREDGIKEWRHVHKTRPEYEEARRLLESAGAL